MAKVVRLNARVDGMQATLNRIQLELMGVKNRTYRGMYLAMKHLEFQMDTVSPMVPIDTEFMRKSWFILGANHATNNPLIIAGYRAWYAPIVHEMISPTINWTRAGSGPKWLQIHFARNIEEMKLIVAQNAMIKPGSRSYGASLPPESAYTNINNRTNERNVEF